MAAVPHPVGKPLELSPEALDQAAVIGPVDVATARVLWQQYAPPPLVDLLDARPVQVPG